MPPSARKSSVGAARRAVQKSHVPYRGDDPTVGKKTGISVHEIPRGSDGFEPFDELFKDAPSGPRKRQRRSKPHREEDDSDDENDDGDEDGEMSMDVDSPIQNYANNRPPHTPRTSRPIARTSAVDFDQVPSPRPRGSAPGSAQRTPRAGPSRLAPSELLELEDDYGAQEQDNYDAQEESYNTQDQENYSHGTRGASPRQLSFTEMDTRDEDDEEEEEGDLPPPPKSSPRNKGKGKAPAVQDEENDLEDDISRGMDDIDMAPPDSDDDEPAPAPKSPPKKTRFVKEKPPVKSSKRQKENRELPPGEREVPDGVRRSSRVPIAPLDWWRGEKVEFGRDHSSASERILVPRIRAIIRIPADPVVPLGKRGRSARKRSRSASAAPKGGVKVVEKIIERVVEGTANPEEGWDDETETVAVVKSWPGDQEVTRRIAFTARMFNPSAAANNEWFFQKIFGDDEFIAAGQIVIPPKGRKPSKLSKDNTFIFFVVEGAVNLKVCDTSLIVASGGMFMVPRGNTYFIENIAERDAKLFFTQARKMREGEGDDEDAQQGQGRVASSSGQGQLQVRGAQSQPPRTVPVAVYGAAAGKRGMSSIV
ncbi:Mif2/CENP-C like-domain-containing protein [Mycena vitilis]|nr:Mif2/CENP-C like-domain-containing protein [Mycena vitilis]